MHGRSTGYLTSLPPSGKRPVTPAAWILTFEGDRVKESHHYFDMMSLLIQIGALPGQSAEAAGA